MALLSFTALARTASAVVPLEQLNEREKHVYDFVQSLIQPLPEEKIFFHYGKSEPCQALIDHGTYTGPIAAKYGNLSVKGGALAGHGVYIAGNPHSSADYFKGGAVEVRLAKGSPILDLTSHEVLEKLREAGIMWDEVYDLPIDATVRYSAGSDWWVVKGATGVTFEPFNWNTLTELPDLGDHLHKMPIEMQEKIVHLLAESGRDLTPIAQGIERSISKYGFSILPTKLKPEVAEKLLHILIVRPNKAETLARLWLDFAGDESLLTRIADTQVDRLRGGTTEMPPQERINRLTFALFSPKLDDSGARALVMTVPEAERAEVIGTIEKFAKNDKTYVPTSTSTRAISRTLVLGSNPASLLAKFTGKFSQVRIQELSADSIAKVLKETRVSGRSTQDLLLILRGADQAPEQMKDLARIIEGDLRTLLRDQTLTSPERVDRILMAGLIREVDDQLLAKAWKSLTSAELELAAKELESMFKLLEDNDSPMRYLTHDSQMIRGLGRIVGLMERDLPKTMARTESYADRFTKVAARTISLDPPRIYTPSDLKSVNHCRGFLHENWMLLKVGGTAGAAFGGWTYGVFKLSQYARESRYDSAVTLAATACVRDGGRWAANPQIMTTKLGQCECRLPMESGGGTITIPATWDGKLVQLARCESEASPTAAQ